MSGTIVNLLERRRLEFSYLTGSASQSVTLIPSINACGYGFVALYARLHARSMAVGQSLTFSLYNILPSDEDAREFVETDVAGNPVSCLDLTVTTSLPSADPGMYSNSTSSTGPFLKLGMKATQASSPATFYAEISLVLLMRESR